MITIDQVTKTYGSQRAVDQASFTAPDGQVTGFLGPNGAGKSTTLTILTSLQRSESGSATINGQTFTQLTRPMREVGVMLNANALHPGRTGTETLKLAAVAAGIPQSRANDMLERVGIGSAGSKRVGNYSLGMRQRLGIGVALMGDPHTLVLDEPANGLDPEGIRWMRGLLNEFADRGGTVLLSSHLLTEVQAIADRIVVINKGTIVAEGSAASLMADSSDVVRVTSPDLGALGQVLTAAGIAVTADGSHLLASADAITVAQAAFDARVLVTGLEPVHQNLEDVFFHLNAGSQA